MDRRFFLALLLTVVVIAITPILFPTPPRPVAPRAAGDTLGRGAATPATGGQGAPLVSAPVEPLPARDTAGALGAAPAPIVAETTVVAGEKATYRVSSLGAAPVGVTLREFDALRRVGTRIVHGEPVELVPRGERLLGYTLLSPRDTIALDTVPFRVERAGGPGGRETLTYTATPGGARVTIAYTFAPDSYLVHVRGAVEGVASPAYLLVHLPSTIRSQEADTVDDRRNLAYAFKPVRGDAESIPFAKLDSGERRVVPEALTWVAAKSKYFVAGLLTPPGGAPFAELAVRDVRGGQKVPSRAQATAIAALTDGTFAFQLYAGPQEWRRLNALGRQFENVNPYGGWFQGLIQPFATAVMQLLLWMRDRLELGYGLVLVVFGILVRVVLWPLNQRMMRSSIKMQRLQPEMLAIQKKYADDQMRLREEMMKVYRKHGMSPFSPIAGCLPALLPMPFLIALFFVFQNTIEFRGVPFLWLPDISQPDPYYIMPLLTGVTMFILSWIGMRGMPPNPQTKVMLYVFPVMMTVLFITLASGLHLYYTVQNLAALPQQWLIARERAAAGPPATAGGSAPAPGPAAPAGSAVIPRKVKAGRRA